MKSCVLCDRPCENLSGHHVIPECRGGAEKIEVCSDCHLAIHQFFSNKELDREYSTIDALLSNEQFAKHIRWLSKQPVTTKFKTKLKNEQRNRGRNG